MSRTHAENQALERIARFLTKLKWGVVNGDMAKMTSFSIDCIRFRFDPPLDQETQYRMLEYLYTLDMTDLRAIAKAAIWFLQKKCPFRITHAWHWNLPVRYNLSRIRTVHMLRKFVKKHKVDALEYDLSSDGIALRDMPDSASGT